MYKNDVDNLKTRNSTLHTLIQAILNLKEEEAFDLVREIRTCESLDAVAEKIVAKEHGLEADDADVQWVTCGWTRDRSGISEARQT